MERLVLHGVKNRMKFEDFRKCRVLLRLVSGLLIVGYVVFIVLNIHSMTLWHWGSIVIAGIWLVWIGRGFCGYFCPVGTSLDLIHWLCKKCHIKEVKRSEKFTSCINILKYPFCVFYFVLHFGIGIDPGWALVVLLIFTTPIFVRFWCSICPVGTILGLFNGFSVFKLKKDADACVNCSVCARVCPMNNEEICKVKESKSLCMTSCIFCGECVGKCPKAHALKLEAMGKELLTSGKKKSA